MVEVPEARRAEVVAHCGRRSLTGGWAGRHDREGPARRPCGDVLVGARQPPFRPGTLVARVSRDALESVLRAGTRVRCVLPVHSCRLGFRRYGRPGRYDTRPDSTRDGLPAVDFNVGERPCGPRGARVTIWWDAHARHQSAAADRRIRAHELAPQYGERSVHAAGRRYAETAGRVALPARGARGGRGGGG